LISGSGCELIRIMIILPCFSLSEGVRCTVCPSQCMPFNFHVRRLLKTSWFSGSVVNKPSFALFLNVFRLMIDSRILRIRPEVFGAKPASCAVNRLRTSASSSAAAAAGSVKSADVRRRKASCLLLNPSANQTVIC